MKDMDAVPNIQPRAFHLCNVNPSVQIFFLTLQGLVCQRVGEVYIPSSVESDNFAKPCACGHTGPVVYTSG
jgi:hypothetical protein